MASLVKDQNFKLTIPVKGELTSIFGLEVDGNPPMKPVSDYKIVGKSIQEQRRCFQGHGEGDLGHQCQAARACCMPALFIPRPLVRHWLQQANSTKASFPTAQVVVKGNLVGVVSPSEWEAVQACAAGGSRQPNGPTGRACPEPQVCSTICEKMPTGKHVPSCNSGKPSSGDVPPAMASAAKKHSASYEVPYLKHAPIGPTMALADVRPDGSVTSA